MVLGCMFGGVGCRATDKGGQQRYFFLFILFVLITKVYLYRPKFICTDHIMSYPYFDILPVLLVLQFCSDREYYLC